MGKGIKWFTWMALAGLTVWLGWNVWSAVTTYESMTTEQIAIEQKKEAEQRLKFEQQMQAESQSELPFERPRKHGFFGDSAYQNVKRALRDAGSDSALLAWIAFGFWLAVESVKRVGKWASEPLKRYFRHVVSYLREHHRTIGWLSFGLTAVHSIYYLALWMFKSVNFDWLLIWSGIIAFVAFLLLALWGEWLQRHGRDRKARYVHWAMSLVMITGMIVHDFGTLGKLFIIAGIFVGFYWIHRLVGRLWRSKVPVTIE